jgi:hypothetical protein
MKSLWSAAALLLVFVAGCDGTSAPGDAPGTPGETASAPVESPGEPGPAEGSSVRPPDPPDPPGTLGSPIKYDSSQLGSGDRPAGEVRNSVLLDLDGRTEGLGCPRPRCGVTVVVKGSETACAKAITPPGEVARGGVVKISTGSCPKTEEPPPPEESTSTTPTP